MARIEHLAMMEPVSPVVVSEVVVCSAENAVRR